MTHNEYNNVCEKILTSTMQYINMAAMNSHNLPRPAQITDPVYTSAVIDPGPVTLVYTPAGSGKSKLIQDRTNALMAAGISPQDIIILNMNIAKVRQMSDQMPGVNVMTFNDFVHGIFTENIPCIQASDMDSVIASLHLLDPQEADKTSLLAELIRKLSVSSPDERNVLLTLFVNNHMSFVIDVLTEIGKADGTLESMVAQNAMYQFSRDPYEAKAILVNGVHNMPLPVLCCLLEYAFMHKCSLFMTGSPAETIYEFSMAYPNAMNSLSAYAGKGLRIIRLMDRKNISDDMRNVLDRNMASRIQSETVSAQHINSSFTLDALRDSLTRENGYLAQKLQAKEKVLIIARSKMDIAMVNSLLEEIVLPKMPSLKIADLTSIPAPSAFYGTVLGKAYPQLYEKYAGGITMGCLFMELYEILAQKEAEEQDNVMKLRYGTRKNELLPWSQAHQARFSGYDAFVPLLQAIQTVIDIESEDIQNHMKRMREDPETDTSDADIILSTIHAAIDFQTDNVILIARDMNHDRDENLYRVALSRARKTEHIIFINRRPAEHPYQKYLRTHIMT